MFKPKTNYAKIAFDSILFYVSTGQLRKENLEKISDDLKLKCACIVSIYDLQDNLRGRYGNLVPVHPTLYDEIVENSVNAATNLPDSKPLQSSELNLIKVVVDVLSVLHKVENFEELKPKKHGLYIIDQKGKSGFILPNVKGINTYQQQIEWVKKKYDITENDISKLDISYFKSTSYD